MRTPLRRADCPRPAPGAPLFIGGEHRSTKQSREQARGVPSDKWDERDGCRVALSASPARAPIEELGPSRADHEERDAGHPIGERVDEVEQGVVGPVDVLEDEHDGPRLREHLEEAAPGCERLAESRRPDRVCCSPMNGRRCRSIHDRSFSSERSLGRPQRPSRWRPRIRRLENPSLSPSRSRRAPRTRPLRRRGGSDPAAM